MSHSANPASASRRAAPTSAALPASGARWNIVSEVNSPPSATPKRPPASRSPSHASTLWAHPARCSRTYASTRRGVSHSPPSRGPAHAAATSANAASTRIAYGRDRIARATERGTRKPSIGITPRGSHV